MMGALGGLRRRLRCRSCSRSIDVLPFGWRALYAVGVVPLLLLPLFRRGVRETRALHASTAIDRAPQGAPRPAGGWLGPIVDLLRAASGARARRGRSWRCFRPPASVAVFQFTGYFVQTVARLGAVAVLRMVILGGALGILGNVVAGRLGDRSGAGAVRLRRDGAASRSSSLGFYQGPGWAGAAGLGALRVLLHGAADHHARDRERALSDLLPRHRLRLERPGRDARRRARAGDPRPGDPRGPRAGPRHDRPLVVGGSRRSDRAAASRDASAGEREAISDPGATPGRD